MSAPLQVNITDAARLLSVSRDTIYRMIRASIHITHILCNHYAQHHRAALTLPLLRGMTEADLLALPQIGPARADIIRRTLEAYARFEVLHA